MPTDDEIETRTGHYLGRIAAAVTEGRKHTDAEAESAIRALAYAMATVAVCRVADADPVRMAVVSGRLIAALWAAVEGTAPMSAATRRDFA